ncbi:hypothetical protein [Polyangium fumosum]|uniref:Uncharacterized protein n=1 Tax=Polyangium fumosum TaxID=889272 RepID=A0A4U1JGZ0_9BACT|nr:hypothetical protein [Polyangium fumosum]TKD11834.1 hypothetical protein E8A74_06795 [Polyangium fumosum]
MATFLVTPRMNPALRARVERAVSPKARARHHAAGLSMASPFASREGFRPAKLLPLLAIVLIGGLFAAMTIHERRELEADRAALLGEIDGLRPGLPPGHEVLVADTERLLVEAAADGEPPEIIDPALRAAGALDATLRRPALYVRAPAAELREVRGIDDAARGSDKDAFLVCLMFPPTATSERDLLAKVRGVYFAGAKVDNETANVRRLAELRVGLAVLAPAFESSVRTAQDRNVLKRMRKDLQKAPVDLAKKAAAAELMLVVADTPAGARVTLFDLAAKKPLLRVLRRHEELTLTSLGATHREELEACSLAVAVRRAVTE